MESFDILDCARKYFVTEFGKDKDGTAVAKSSPGLFEYLGAAWAVTPGTRGDTNSDKIATKLIGESHV